MVEFCGIFQWLWLCFKLVLQWNALPILLHDHDYSVRRVIALRSISLFLLLECFLICYFFLLQYLYLLVSNQVAIINGRKLSIQAFLFNDIIPNGSIRGVGRMLFGTFLGVFPSIQEVFPEALVEEPTCLIKVQFQGSGFTQLVGPQLAVDLDQGEEESQVVLCFPGLFLALLRRHLLLVHDDGVLLIQ